MRNELAPGVSPVVYKPLERCLNRLSRCVVLNDLNQLSTVPPHCALKQCHLLEDVDDVLDELRAYADAG